MASAADIENKRRLKEMLQGPETELPGGSTPEQYNIPEGATDLQDLIEHRQMNFALGNIFKACYRMGSCGHSDALRDVRKILWFADRELQRLDKEGAPHDQN